MRIASPRRTWPIALVLLALAFNARAAVLVVGPGGFPDMQPAVDVSHDGDVILVKPGSYKGFTITNKSLEIHADTGATIYGAVQIQNLAAGKIVTIRGLTVDVYAMNWPEGIVAVTLRSCQGTVWLEDCDLRGGAKISWSKSGLGWPALFAEQCARVVAVRCTMTGGSPVDYDGMSYGTPPPAGEGCSLKSSHAAFFECEILGGRVVVGLPFKNCFPARDGAPGIVLDGISSLVLEASTCKGGEGQDRAECYICQALPGDGGPGILAEATVPAGAVKSRNSAVLGGDPGVGIGCHGNYGPAFVGPPNAFSFLPGTSRSLTVIGPVREGTQAKIDLRGLPNDAVLLFVDSGVGGQAAWPFPGFFALGSPPAVATMLPPLPPTGKATIQVPVPSLPPGLWGIAVSLQALMSDPANTWSATLSSPSRVLVLDSAY